MPETISTNEHDERIWAYPVRIPFEPVVISSPRYSPSGCPKCDTLMELYKRTPQSDRDYWLMTELFVMLHDGDVCPQAFAEESG